MILKLLLLLSWPFYFFRSIGLGSFFRRIYNSLYSAVLMRQLKSDSYVHFQRPVDLVGAKYISIGDNSYFGHHLVLNAWESNYLDNQKPVLTIGSGCSFQSYNHVTCVNRVEIGNNVLTGRWVTICDNNHGDTRYDSVKLPPLERHMTSNGPIIIGDNVWIGDKVTILSGVKIGNNAIIGSNSVVTKDVPPFSVAAGIPAKVIKIISENQS